jgi:hypothetical protein
MIPIFESGYNVANAATTPKIAPEAPTIGIVIISFKLPNNSFCLMIVSVLPKSSHLHLIDRHLH